MTGRRTRRARKLILSESTYETVFDFRKSDYQVCLFQQNSDKTRFTTTWYTATPFNQDFSTFQLNLKKTLLNKAKNLEKKISKISMWRFRRLKISQIKASQVCSKIPMSTSMSTFIPFVNSIKIRLIETAAKSDFEKKMHLEEIEIRFSTIPGQVRTSKFQKRANSRNTYWQ